MNKKTYNFAYMNLLKYLVLLILLVSCNSAFSQGGWTRPNNSYGARMYRSAFDSTLIIPTGTGAAALHAYDLGQSAIYYNRTTHTGWLYNPDTHVWDEIGSGGSGGTFADLTFGYGFVIFDDNPYNPTGPSKAVALDTIAINHYIDSILRTDTTISQSITAIDYVVDTVSNSPPVQPDGYKVLVGTSPTGAFATHEDQVATKVGGVYTYVTAITNQSLEVRNATQLFFYKKTDFGWIRVSVADLIGGITGIVQPDIGTIDSNSFTIKTHNIPAIVIDENQNIYNPKYAGLEDSNLFYRPGLNGLQDTGHFHTLIAGDNITIVNDTISSTGDSSQDLQSVLTVGNTSVSIPINIQDASVSAYNAGLTNIAALDGVNGNISIQTGGTNGRVLATNITSTDKNIELPNISGNLAESVTINGTTTHANATGNINVGTISGGGGASAGNYGNLQLNRNSAFATPASDSLSFISGTLNNKGATHLNNSNGTAGTDSLITQSGGILGKISPTYYLPNLLAPSGYTIHGKTTGVYYDSIIYKDTANKWVGVNWTTPLSTLDIHIASFPGTVAATNGSAALTGTGTRFLDQFYAHDSIYIANVWYGITSIASQTALTLASNYSGSTASGLAYFNPSTTYGLYRIGEQGTWYTGRTTFIVNGAGTPSINTANEPNFGIGRSILTAITTAGGSTAVGNRALQSVTSSQQNTAVGNRALRTLTTGSGGNTAVGYGAMDLATTASLSVAIGQQALGTGSNTGTQNTGAGYQSLVKLTSGGSNSFHGYLSGGNITTGSRNTGVGSSSLANVTVGGNNTTIGVSSGLDLFANSNSNVTIGDSSMGGANANATFPVFFNTMVGTGSGFGVIGNRNLCLGYRATLPYLTSNASNIFNTIWITGNNGSDSTASTTSLVGINKAAPASTLDVNGTLQTLGFITAYTATATGITLTGLHHTVEVTATGQTITLPTAVGATGRIYRVKLTASGSGTVATTASQTIDGSTTYSLSAQYKYVTVQSNGSNWIIIANN